ncbi:hypothetical protein AVEN_53622-1 [Araneus ventricosus]|uniref:Uncharacterized protein n=1 Tax=Araneus ventricosus TaxID=182803 RepID=A0A4Y1ZVS8_ARAVE|nr:hypothetical protein AVEN_70040-1 [Araneus ventricosus]GBN08732.1 hypothetical protein AVEN_53622-1 [Araneus ventricosus]
MCSSDSGISKAGNSSVLHSIHLPSTGFFSSIQVEKSRHVIHLKLQRKLAVGDSDLLFPSTAALRPLFLPLSGFSINVASSRGLNLVKSFDVPTTLAKSPT